MKMEIPVHAPQAGIVRRVLCEPGRAVTPGQTLAVIAWEEA
jgi:urea carboxylase